MDVVNIPLIELEEQENPVFVSQLPSRSSTVQGHPGHRAVSCRRQTSGRHPPPCGYRLKRAGPKGWQPPGPVRSMIASGIMVSLDPLYIRSVHFLREGSSNFLDRKLSSQLGHYARRGANHCIRQGPTSLDVNISRVGR